MSDARARGCASGAQGMYRAQGAVDNTFDFKYAMSRPRPGVPGRPIRGLRSVGAFDVAVPFNTRTKRLRSEQESVHEVYGTAPYLGSGDGVMLYPGVSTELRNSNYTLRGARSRHLITEHSQARWAFIGDRKNVVQSVADQVGMSARDESSYE